MHSLSKFLRAGRKAFLLPGVWSARSLLRRTSSFGCNCSRGPSEAPGFLEALIHPIREWANQRVRWEGSRSLKPHTHTRWEKRILKRGNVDSSLSRGIFVSSKGQIHVQTVFRSGTSGEVRLTAEMEPAEVKKKKKRIATYTHFPFLFMHIVQLNILQKEQRSQIVQLQEADWRALTADNLSNQLVTLTENS